MLFHRDVYLPPCVRLPAAPVALAVSAHAAAAAHADRYGDLSAYLPAAVVPAEWTPVEVETDARLAPTKVLYRRTVKAGLDLCLVVLLTAPGSGLVKTVWANRTADAHRTLDRSRYANPPTTGEDS